MTGLGVRGPGGQGEDGRTGGCSYMKGLRRAIRERRVIISI